MKSSSFVYVILFFLFFEVNGTTNNLTTSEKISDQDFTRVITIGRYGCIKFTFNDIFLRIYLPKSNPRIDE